MELGDQIVPSEESFCCVMVSFWVSKLMQRDFIEVFKQCLDFLLKYVHKTSVQKIPEYIVSVNKIKQFSILTIFLRVNLKIKTASKLIMVLTFFRLFFPNLKFFQLQY